MSAGAILKKLAIICTGRPLAFMKVCGNSSHTPDSAWRPTSAWNLASLRIAMPFWAAKRSISQKPALWRVRSYFSPGLPSPMMSFIN